MSTMIETLKLYLQYPFVRYALIVGVLIALCSSLLGVTLVLKRFSFIGDGLSHVAFGAMAVAAVLKLSDSMLFVLPATVLCVAYRSEYQNKGRCRDCHDFRRGAGHRLPADESVFNLVQFIWRRVQHPVRLHLHPDSD